MSENIRPFPQGEDLIKAQENARLRQEFYDLCDRVEYLDELERGIAGSRKQILTERELQQMHEEREQAEVRVIQIVRHFEDSGEISSVKLFERYARRKGHKKT